MIAIKAVKIKYKRNKSKELKEYTIQEELLSKPSDKLTPYEKRVVRDMNKIQYTVLDVTVMLVIGILLLICTAVLVLGEQHPVQIIHKICRQESIAELESVEGIFSYSANMIFFSIVLNIVTVILPFLVACIFCLRNVIYREEILRYFNLENNKNRELVVYPIR